jgi:hypothetical protein
MMRTGHSTQICTAIALIEPSSHHQAGSRPAQAASRHHPWAFVVGGKFGRGMGVTFGRAGYRRLECYPLNGGHSATVRSEISKLWGGERTVLRGNLQADHRDLARSRPPQRFPYRYIWRHRRLSLLWTKGACAGHQLGPLSYRVQLDRLAELHDATVDG